MTRNFATIDEIREALGQPIGPSAPLLVDQRAINNYADVVGDHQWIHVDPVRAAGGPYGGTIAHGYYTIGLLSHFAEGLYSISFGSAKVNYGFNKVRFPSPVFVDSELRATLTFTDVSEVQAGLMLTQKFVVESGGEKPACVAERLTLITH